MPIIILLGVLCILSLFSSMLWQPPLFPLVFSFLDQNSSVKPSLLPSADSVPSSTTLPHLTTRWRGSAHNILMLSVSLSAPQQNDVLLELTKFSFYFPNSSNFQQYLMYLKCSIVTGKTNWFKGQITLTLLLQPSDFQPTL